VAALVEITGETPVLGLMVMVFDALEPAFALKVTGNISEG
jgi:hypothetical protein